MTQLWLALDCDWTKAEDIARATRDHVDCYKIGSVLFTREGPSIVELISGFGKPIFLDLKFHDIPNTVRGAAQSAWHIKGVRYFSFHLSGKVKMAEAAVNTAAVSSKRFEAVGITVLTSEEKTRGHELKLLNRIRVAEESRTEYMVMSVSDLEWLKQTGKKPRWLKAICPGIRPAGSESQDQKRVATPQRAAQAGAFAIVVGRPILEAENPVEAARAIKEELLG